MRPAHTDAGRFRRYLLAGAANTAVSYVLLAVALQWLHYLLAYTLAYAAGIVLAYMLQSRYVFRVPLRWRSALRFPLVYVVQYVIGVAVLAALARMVSWPAWLTALVVIVVTVPIGFMLSRVVLTTGTRPGEADCPPAA
jgi:putative flippase GtrA